MDRKATGMPENHARPFPLLMEEVHAVGNDAMTAVVYFFLRRFKPSDKRRPRREKAPSVSGGAPVSIVAVLVTAHHEPAARRDESSLSSWM